MTAQQIFDTIRSLSFSQGFYGRLLEQVRENSNILDYLEAQQFGSSLDLILFLES